MLLVKPVFCGQYWRASVFYVWQWLSFGKQRQIDVPKTVIRVRAAGAMQFGTSVCSLCTPSKLKTSTRILLLLDYSRFS